jgi:hypothetical protein
LSCFAEALSLQRSSGILPSEHAGLLVVAGVVLPEGSCSVMDEREIMSIISRAILQMYLLRQAGRDLVFISKPESRERAVAVAVLWGGEVAGRAFPKGRSDSAPPSTTTESLTSPRLKPRHKNSAIIWKY